MTATTRNAPGQQQGWRGVLPDPLHGYTNLDMRAAALSSLELADARQRMINDLSGPPRNESPLTFIRKRQPEVTNEH